jgi:hypothetical protein
MLQVKMNMCQNCLAHTLVDTRCEIVCSTCGAVSKELKYEQVFEEPEYLNTHGKTISSFKNRTLANKLINTSYFGSKTELKVRKLTRLTKLSDILSLSESELKTLELAYSELNEKRWSKYSFPCLVLIHLPRYSMRDVAQKLGLCAKKIQKRLHQFQILSGNERETIIKNFFLQTGSNLKICRKDLYSSLKHLLAFKKIKKNNKFIVWAFLNIYHNIPKEDIPQDVYHAPSYKEVCRIVKLQ